MRRRTSGWPRRARSASSASAGSSARVEKHHATEAAIRLADELDVNLADLEGTGSDGRITVRDVREAQEA